MTDKIVHMDLNNLAGQGPLPLCDILAEGEPATKKIDEVTCPKCLEKWTASVDQVRWLRALSEKIEKEKIQFDANDLSDLVFEARLMGREIEHDRIRKILGDFVDRIVERNKK